MRTHAGRFREVFGMSETRLTPEVLPLFARYNIAPTQPVACVRASAAGREMAPMHWGLIPAWSKDCKIAYSTFNARGETVATKPAFRSAFKSRRCLVVADGFYEWRKLDASGKKKQPYFISLKSESPFGFAGLWETWDQGDGPLESCTIITTTPNELMAPLHDRMPVILRPDDYDLWLDPNVKGGEKIQLLIRPYASVAMQAWPVSPAVNKGGLESSELVTPLEA